HPILASCQIENMFKTGPKEMKGEIWDEKGSFEAYRGNTRLVEILITHQQDVINSIRFTYRKGDNVFHSQTYGEPYGLNFDMVDISDHNEVLTSVSGELLDGRLASIVFGTNKKTYGPFGRTGSKEGHMEAPPPPSSSSSLSLLQRALFLSLPTTQSQDTSFSPGDILSRLTSVSLSGSNPLPLSSIPPPPSSQDFKFLSLPTTQSQDTTFSPSDILSTLTTVSSIPAVPHPRHSGSYEDFKYQFKPDRFGGFHGSVYDGSVYAIGVNVKPYELYTLDDFMDDLNGCDEDDP
ncbi:hypothetical protein M8C21_025511, partial [Ambrosia artemisiifolia]